MKRNSNDIEFQMANSLRNTSRKLHVLMRGGVLLALVWMAVATSLTAQVPGDAELPTILSYQGVLTDLDNLRVPDGSYDMTFRIYTEESGGTPIWEETQSVSTFDGVFDAYLGLNNPLEIPFDQQYWIAASIEGETEMEPRTRLVPAPYAFTAQRAVEADNFTGTYVRSLNGESGDVNLSSGPGISISEVDGDVLFDLALGYGALWIGNEEDHPEELPIGQPGNVLTVNDAGTQPEWSDEIQVSTIRVGRIEADSTFINEGLKVDGTAVFNDTVVFNGHVILKFPPDNALTHNAIPVGNEEDRVSELQSTNTQGAVLQQDAGGAPTWSNDLQINNLTVNGTTNIESDVTNIQSNDITIGPVNSHTTFEGDVTFNQTPNIALQLGHLWVGGTTGYQTPLAPGDNGDILSIINGTPQWEENPGGLLPQGRTLNSTLVWNGSEWVENGQLTSEPLTGNTTMGGNLIVNGGYVELPEASINNYELQNSSIYVDYGPGVSGSPQVSLGSTLYIEGSGIVDIVGTPNQINVQTNGTTATISTPQDIHTGANPTFAGMTLTNIPSGSSSGEVLVTNGGVVESRDATDVFSSVNLTEGNIWVGDGTNSPMELAPGSDGEVLTSVGGTPVYQPINAGDIGLSENSIWVGDNAGMASELGTTNVEGAVLQQDASGAPVWDDDLNVTNITSTSITTNNITTNDITVNDTAIFNSTTIFNMTPDIPLGHNHIWVGDATGYQAAVAPGSSGQVLRINGSGSPTWDDVAELPTGTTTNSTLVWNGSNWTENTNVTMDPNNGNTDVNGDLNIDGSLSGAGSNRYAGTASIPFGTHSVNVSYAGIESGATVNVSVQDTDNNIGIVPARVTSITPGVGFTVQLAINYDSNTGSIHYVVVNP